MTEKKPTPVFDVIQIMGNMSNVSEETQKRIFNGKTPFKIAKNLPGPRMTTFFFRRGL